MLVGGVKGLDNQLLVGLVGDAITDAEMRLQPRTRSTRTGSSRRAA